MAGISSQREAGTCGMSAVDTFQYAGPREGAHSEVVGNAVYFGEDGSAFAVRVGGRLLPVARADVVARVGPDQVTTVDVTLLAPNLRFIYVASGEAEALLSEARATIGGAK